MKDLDERSHGYRLQKQKQLTGPFEIHVNDDDTQIPPEIWKIDNIYERPITRSRVLNYFSLYG